MDEDKINQILDYWLGNVESSVVPSNKRYQIWFGKNQNTDDELRQLFGDDLGKAIAGAYDNWAESARGTLALIILFDQFSRNVYRGMPQAFDQDKLALDLCLYGIEKQFDHDISLIERVFFYMPLMHAEDLDAQTTSMRAFQILVELALPETRDVFENFLDYAIKHYEIIRRFGRYPHRNETLGRTSTEQEIEFLKGPDSSF